MKELFLLSGLGADKRIFDFMDLTNYKLNYIEWIEPIEKESIESYAHRILDQIPIDKPILLGVSFGGMMAIEIAKLIETEKIILISSIKTRNELPGYFKLIGFLRLNRFVPAVLLKKVNLFTYWIFGVYSKHDRDLLKRTITETDSKFLAWAIDKIVNWKNKAVLKDITHIHGTHDRLLPITESEYQISGGGHLMMINKSSEISRVINSLLS